MGRELWDGGVCNIFFASGRRWQFEPASPADRVLG